MFLQVSTTNKTDSHNLTEILFKHHNPNPLYTGVRFWEDNILTISLGVQFIQH
jgi:hypothetical protein